ncbi:MULTISPECIES: HEAT repeat domain-containing protein [unclassified Microcoleus]|uniref:HEAT repeat domain-containing protein n=1 Tax=unclassified Microcoleus TaxID=2642155 RepID=UPI0025DA742F|nr:MULTISPECIES: HEAT repeat domain-containing protein [unclassified Microcoleus]
MATPVDFPKYLQSLIKSYESQPDLYTLTDLQVEVRVEISPEDRSPETPKNKPETKIERLEVLAGIRKYLRDGNVLLVGKPGSGKSTVLQRFRWELAREALKDCDRPIPILVQLRSDRSIEQAICAEFRQAKLRVSTEEVKDLLLDDKLLLLLDGVNEIPSQQRRQEFQLFRDENSDTPMILTTRDLALGGSFGIEKKLEMCALTEAQMREFVHKHLPQHGDLLLRQLRDRLREIAETPLLLWMMCEVFESTGEIPQSKGELFQKFDRQYDDFKGCIPVSDDFRRFKSDILPQLAFVMLQGDLQQPAEGLVAISRDRAEGILECWLRARGVLDAPTKAKEWLEDLLEHHLLQVAAKPEEIEFHHQLFQEYYAGRALLKLLVEKHQDAIDDERLQHFYLNYFKWTEPLAFMLSSLGDEVQAVRVVRLALDVDLMLGARLAGEVKRVFQQRTVGLVDGLDVPGWLKVGLLGEVRSDEAIPGLLKFVEDSDSDVRRRVADALGAIGSELAISELFKLVEDSDSHVRWSVADALGKIGDKAAISGLFKLVEDSDSGVRWSVTDALGEISSDAAITELIELLEDSDSYVRMRAAYALGNIGSEVAIPGLLKLVKDSDSYVRKSMAYALSKIGSQAGITELLKLVEDSESDSYIRMSVADALGNIGSEVAIPALLKLVEDSESHSYIRMSAADALGNIGSEVAIPGLLKLVGHLDSYVRMSVANALGKIGSEAGVLGLLKLAKDSDSYVRRRVADALGKIGSDVCILGLLELAKDSDSYVCMRAADALGNIGSTIGIPELFKLVKHSDSYVRMSAVDALYKIAFDVMIPDLVELVEHSDSYVRRIAAEALGEIGDKAGISGLLKLLEDSDSYVRITAINALGNIGSEAGTLGLLKVVENSKLYMRKSAAEALGKIGNKAAILGLFKLVEDSDLYVRNSAIDALANIAKQHKEKVAPHLPHLLTLIPSEFGTKVHPIILAIQAACKYYDYEIRQLSLTPQPAKPPQPNELLAKIDETTQQIDNRTKQMADQPTQDFSKATFNALVNFGTNNGNQAQNLTIAAQQSSPEAALNAVVQIIQALEKKYTYVKDEEQALNIIDAEFKEIKEQKGIEWQNLISVKRLYNGGKNAAVKVGEHFAESNPWGKGIVAFIEGVSEDVN